MVGRWQVTGAGRNGRIKNGKLLRYVPEREFEASRMLRTPGKLQKTLPLSLPYGMNFFCSSTKGAVTDEKKLHDSLFVFPTGGRKDVTFLMHRTARFERDGAGTDKYTNTGIRKTARLQVYYFGLGDTDR